MIVIYIAEGDFKLNAMMDLKLYRREVLDNNTSNIIQVHVINKYDRNNELI